MNEKETPIKPGFDRLAESHRRLLQRIGVSTVVLWIMASLIGFLGGGGSFLTGFLGFIVGVIITTLITLMYGMPSTTMAGRRRGDRQESDK